MFFSLCGIIQIFLLTMSLEGFKVVLDNMLESAWVFFTAPHAKVLNWHSMGIVLLTVAPNKARGVKKIKKNGWGLYHHKVCMSGPRFLAAFP